MSLHIPLLFGTLKIKTRSRLRREEVTGKVPVLQVGAVYFVWMRRR
jgi:hypothetical protein